MAERRTVLLNVIANTGGAIAGMKGLGAVTGQTSGSVGKLTKSFGGLKAVGIGAGIAVAAGAVFAVKAFAGFDQKMTESLAIMGDISTFQRGEMSDAAREVGLTTKFSAEQAAESYFFLASAGLDAKQSIAALPQVAAFAQAGMFDMALATDLATDAQSALGLTSEDAGENLKGLTRVTDVFVKANTLANTSVQQVSEAITNKLGGALRSYNIEIEEGVAVLAAYADQGLKGAAAGEAMNIMLRDLRKVGRESADVLAENNIAIFDANGNFRAQADIIDDLTAAFAPLSVAQQGQLAADLGFQDRSFKNIQLLFGMGDAVRSYNADLHEAAGTTQEIADKQLETLNAQLGLAKAKIIDMAIGLGEELAPAALAAVEGLAGILETLGPIIVAVGQATGAFIGLVDDGLLAVKSLAGDEAATAMIRLNEAVEGVTEAAEAGESQAVAYANGLVHMAASGTLTQESLAELTGEVEFAGEEQEIALAKALEWARANESSAETILVLKNALREQIEALDLTEEATAALIEQFGVQETASDRGHDAANRLRDGVEDVGDAMGETGDEAGDLAGSINGLEQALIDAEDAQTSLADAMLAFADPVFAASKSIIDLAEAEAGLVEVQSDHHASAEDVAAAELEVFEATLKAQGAMDAFSASGLEGQVQLIMDVMGKTKEEAFAFLEALGLIDGTEVTAGATVIFSAGGSAAAQSAVTGGAATFTGITQRQHGGPATKDEPILVGEAGPEVFVPNANGMILPNPGESTGDTTTTTTSTSTFIFNNSRLTNNPVQAMRTAAARDAVGRGM